MKVKATQNAIYFELTFTSNLFTLYFLNKILSLFIISVIIQ